MLPLFSVGGRPGGWGFAYEFLVFGCDLVGLFGVFLGPFGRV